MTQLPPMIELVGDHLLVRNLFLDESEKLAILDALKGIRSATIEECAKVADKTADEIRASLRAPVVEKRSGMFDRLAAKMATAEVLAKSIRSLTKAGKGE